ncbi:MAG: sulfite exporter TauE/SafE family protein [Bacteroidota bacterium]
MLNEISTQSWLLAAASAFILGVAKAGLKGLDAIIVTLLALAFGSKASTGILVPLLIVGDILAVIYYRRDLNRKLFLRIIPWILVGIVIGAIVAVDMPERGFRYAMATIIIISVMSMIALERRSTQEIPSGHGFASLMGILAGVTTMIGNLAGAFANIYFLALRVPKNEFIGTAAWLFFVVNLFKLPFHIFSWHTITEQSLRIDAVLAGMVIVGFAMGVRVVSYISNQAYRHMILGLTMLGAVLILIQ